MITNSSNQCTEQFANDKNYDLILDQNSIKRQRFDQIQTIRQSSINTTSSYDSSPIKQQSNHLKSLSVCCECCQNLQWSYRVTQSNPRAVINRGFSSQHFERPTIDVSVNLNQLGNGLSVLIVDDNSSALKLLMHHLQTLGCSVNFVSDGHVCLNLFRQFKLNQCIKRNHSLESRSSENCSSLHSSSDFKFKINFNLK